MNRFLWLGALVCAFSAYSATIKGKVLSQSSQQPLSDIIVQLVNVKNKVTFTDQTGAYRFNDLPAGTYYVYFSSIGYTPVTDTVELSGSEARERTISLKDEAVNISEITVTARKESGMNSLSAVDFKIRPHLTTQDLMRLVPGLFIAQHAGGGKAESMLVRGFDADHGTDVAISVDNMPANMASHAHGQGYADLHFVIPETVERLSFSKGPFDVKYGDFNTAASVRFQTKAYLPNNLVKAELGTFNTFRGVTLLNLFPKTDSSIQKHNAYIAAEYYYTNGFFVNPQDFSKVNLFGRYTGQLDRNTTLAFTLSTFGSKWNASGEIPERAVKSGLIDKYGSIDPSEGGATSRYNANLTLSKRLANDAILQNQIYYVRYVYNLYSNFTFFKEDSVNGDEILQHEVRHMFGYNGSYTKESHLGPFELKSTIGLGIRDDQIGEEGTAHVRKRNYLNDITLGQTHVSNLNAYLDETVYFSPRLSLNLGLRLDQFHFGYRDKMVDTVENNYSDASATAISPKFNLFYNLTNQTQIYLSAGSGFHSNDARVAVISPGNIIAKANSAEVGTNLKVGKNLFLNSSLWWMDLSSEYVWNGEEGGYEASGRTRRVGIDVSARYQVLSWLFLDGDVTFSKPRYLDEPEGQNYVPVAPPMTSIAGINVRTKTGITGSLRYRYLSARPLSEDNTIRANDYFILDAVFGYTYKKVQFGLMAENLLNKYWREAQYATESQLKGEPEPVNEVHYTPGTPFNLRGNVTMFF